MKLPVNYNMLSTQRRREVREEYVRRQKGLCLYCGAPLEGKPAKEVRGKKVTKSLYPESFFKWPIHLHHDHITGMTKGAVHCYCNAVMWEYDGE